MARLAAAVVREVDLDTVVDRNDLDRVVERLDVDAIVTRVGFEKVARQLLEQVDIEEIIRESTSAWPTRPWTRFGSGAWTATGW